MPKIPTLSPVHGSKDGSPIKIEAKKQQSVGNTNDSTQNVGDNKYSSPPANRSISPAVSPVSNSSPTSEKKIEVKKPVGKLNASLGININVQALKGGIPNVAKPPPQPEINISNSPSDVTSSIATSDIQSNLTHVCIHINNILFLFILTINNLYSYNFQDRLVWEEGDL